MTTAPIIATLKETTAVRANGHEAAAPKPEAPAPPFDFTTLSDEQLDQHLADGHADKDRREGAALAAMARVFGLPVERLKVTIERETAAKARPNARPTTGSRDRRSEVAPKYVDPADPTGKRTWSGRGQPPEWIEFGTVADPKTGKSQPLPKFLIQKDPA